MTVYELVEKLGGEIVGNVAQVRQNNIYTILAKHNGVDFVFTEAGQKLANEEGPLPAKRGRKPKGLLVESNFEVNLDV
jgi:hypothetical protein